MNRKLALLLLLLLSLIQSCKKGSTETDGPIKDKIYLVKSINDHPVGNNLGRVTKFMYDDKNRMINAKAVSSYEYRYTYDENDRLTDVAVYDDHSKKLFQTWKYVYTANNITASYTTAYIPGSLNTRVYELRDGRVISEKYAEGDDIDNFIYDGRGNITEVRGVTDGKITHVNKYTFDEKKSPFAMVKTVNPHCRFAGLGIIYCPVNNITAIEGFSSTTYKFNADGFPISATVDYKDYDDSIIDYEYYVK